MDLRLSNKRALVTGGTKGIGFAIAKCLLDEGAEVIVASRRRENVESAVGQLQQGGGARRVSGLCLDLLEESQIRDAVKRSLSTGSIDILVNNVGGPASGAVLGLAIEDWDRGYTSLLRSVILLCQLIVPTMKEKKWGRILTITSTTAKEIIPSLPVSSTFRAGLSAWTKTMAKEVGRSGILINNILPGMTETARLNELVNENPSFFESQKEDIGVGRFAEPEEISKVAVFLASEANTYLTGTDVVVDGGYTHAI